MSVDLRALGTALLRDLGKVRVTVEPLKGSQGLPSLYLISRVSPSSPATSRLDRNVKPRPHLLPYLAPGLRPEA